MQYQIPIFSVGTKGDLILRFDDCVADALGIAARTNCPDRRTGTVAFKGSPKTIPPKVSKTLLEYYIANKPTDGDWRNLPVKNANTTSGVWHCAGFFFRAGHL